jgi:hypothetical protein
MGTVVTLFLAVAAMVIVYAWLGQGGAVSGLILFAGVLAAGVFKLMSANSGS